MLPLEAIAIPTLTDIHIHLIAFDQQVYKINVIAVTLMTSRKTRAHEVKMVARYFIEMIKHHYDKGTEYAFT